MSAPLPPTMRAVQFHRYGGPEVLELRSIPLPSPEPGGVLVRVHASGLNPKDAFVRDGSLRLVAGRRFPRGTGFDFAGEVVASGSRVADLPPGTRVWGFLDGFLGGAAAEYVAAPREWMAVMPRRLEWVEAAALPLVASTALQALRDHARLRAGERLLIKGASGGVGSAAIQIGRATGAHVTALATGEGLDHCAALGADAVVDYRRSRPESPEQRFDVLLDCAGSSPLHRYRRLLARRGRWVTVAPAPLVFALAPVSRLLAPVLGVPRLGHVVVKPRGGDLEEIGGLVERGQLRMPVTGIYPLEEIRQAQDRVARRHGPGKRVLVIVSPGG